MAIKKIYFVRHGETAGNATQTFQFPDTPLAEAGHEGAKAVALRFKHIAVDALFASPFTRAQETATYISETTGQPIVIFEPLYERLQPLAVRGKAMFGEEGQAYFSRKDVMYRDSSDTTEGFENYDAVIARVEECVDMLEKCEKSNIVVVSHGAFLRSITSYLLLKKSKDMENHLAVDSVLKTMSNVGITEFEYVDGVWQLFTWNDHAHFAE